MSKYELHSEVECKNGELVYVFIAESDNIKELTYIPKEVVCSYIIIDNSIPQVFIDGVKVSKKDYNSEYFINMIKECKLAREAVNKNSQTYGLDEAKRYFVKLSVIERKNFINLKRK